MKPSSFGAFIIPRGQVIIMSKGVLIRGKKIPKSLNTASTICMVMLVAEKTILLILVQQLQKDAVASMKS